MRGEKERVKTVGPVQKWNGACRSCSAWGGSLPLRRGSSLGIEPPPSPFPTGVPSLPLLLFLPLPLVGGCRDLLSSLG